MVAREYDTVDERCHLCVGEVEGHVENGCRDVLASQLRNVLRRCCLSTNTSARICSRSRS